MTGKIYEVRAIGKKIDSALAELFTKDGIVQGAGKYIIGGMKRDALPLGNDTHFYLGDGQLHTIHIYSDLSASKRTGVYLPEGFSGIKYLGTRMASVIAQNSNTKVVIRASHIYILSDVQFDTKKKTNSEISQDMSKIQAQLNKNITNTNSKGSRYIGETGGPQGNSVGYLHAHLSIFKDMKSMTNALNYKYSDKSNNEYDSSIKRFLGDFRNLVQVS